MAEIVVRVTATGLAERIGDGAVVDLDRVLSPANGDRPAFTLADAIAGREDAFEAVDAPANLLDGLPVDDDPTLPRLDPSAPFEPFTTATAAPGTSLPPASDFKE